MIEPERYELFAEPAYSFTLDRRQFLKSGLRHSGIFHSPAPAAESAGARVVPKCPKKVSMAAHWGKWNDHDSQRQSGSGTEYPHSLAQVVSEELHVPVDSIVIIFAIRT